MSDSDKKNNLMHGDGFALVKTKDGKMMYRHNGKYYSTEEMMKLAGKTKDVSSGLQQSQNNRTNDAVEFEELKVDDGAVNAKQRADEIMAMTVAQVVKELKITFADDAKKQKFTKILESFLREIRTPKEFLYILTAPESSAGFGISAEKADGIVNASKRHLAVLHENRRKKIAPLAAPVSPVALAVAKPVAVLPVTTVVKSTAKAEQPIAPKVKVEPKIEKAVAKVENKFSFDDNRIRLTSVKKPTADIRRASTLVGPAEELFKMDVSGLRKIGRDSQERLEELKERFILLQETSLSQWILGKQNWQKSPLFLTYLEVGMKSLKENRPVKEFLQGDFKSEDFTVVLELNKWLNY